MLIACVTFVIAILMLIGALALLGTPHGTPASFLTGWLEGTSRLSSSLNDQINPVSTGPSIVTLTTALVLACAFSRKPDALLMPTEVIRLRFLETITNATSAIAGSVLVTCSLLLVFGGLDKAIPAALSLASGLLTLSLGAMVPVSPQYWAQAIEEEDRKIALLKDGQPRTSKQIGGRSAWVQTLTVDAALRVLWFTATFALVAAVLDNSLAWGRVFGVGLPATIAIGIAWDFATKWSRLYLATTRIIDKWDAIPIYIAWLTIFLMLALGFIGISLQTTWIAGLFLTGCFSIPFVTTMMPRLGRSWGQLYAARFDEEINRASYNLARYQALRQLAQSEREPVNQATPCNNSHFCHHVPQAHIADAAMEKAEGCRRCDPGASIRRTLRWPRRRKDGNREVP